MSDDNTLEYNNVSNPKHYCGSVSLECIDVMRVSYGDIAVGNFCICNAFKYMWRYKNKNGREDLDKAHWYLEYVENLIHEMLAVCDDIYEEDFKNLQDTLNRTMCLFGRVLTDD